MRLGALLWRACRLGGGMLSPRTRGPSVPSQITPNSANLREHHCATCWRPEALKTTPPLTPQVHLPGRCAPDNQHHGPSPDPTQTIRCHQVVRPKRLQSFSAAWKEGSSFLCILCFIFIYFFYSILLIALFYFLCMYLIYFLFLLSWNINCVCYFGI